MKDNFSAQSEIYSKFRPTYPLKLIEYLVLNTSEHKNAWDCGTGNGQLAVKLSDYFNYVYATDISKNQITNSMARKNIIYMIESCEKTQFENDKFDLITVAQALHWFNFSEFYKEVYRTLKSNGIFAAITYTLPSINDRIDNIIQILYSDILEKYWDPERKYVDDEYKLIPFPFKEIATRTFISNLEWTFDELVGYLQSWSAVQHYKKKHTNNPINSVIKQLKAEWGKDENKNITFKIILRTGKLKQTNKLYEKK